MRRGATWLPVDADHFVHVIATLWRERREWPEEAVNVEIDKFIEENGLGAHLIMFTDGSVKDVSDLAGAKRQA